MTKKKCCKPLSKPVKTYEEMKIESQAMKDEICSLKNELAFLKHTDSRIAMKHDYEKLTEDYKLQHKTLQRMLKSYLAALKMVNILSSEDYVVDSELGEEFRAPIA